MKLVISEVSPRVKTLSKKAFKQRRINMEQQVQKVVNVNHIHETLERQAELISPEEYIKARAYLSDLEQMRLMQEYLVF